MVKLILGIIEAIARWLSNKSDPKAVEKREAQERFKEAQKAVEEIAKRDEDAVNARLRKWMPVLPLAFLLLGGCATQKQVVYIPETDRVVFMERAGRPGWWVPEGVFSNMVEKLETKGK